VAIAPRATELADSISELESSRSPVLIFEVDTGAFGDNPKARGRGGVRLLGSMRGGDGGEGGDDGRALLPADQEISAVLVLRALTPARLLSCIRAVTRGGDAMPPELIRQMLPAGEHHVHRQITHREHEVLHLLAEGCSTRAIAERLSYSERTVKAVVHDLLEKLNCRTRAHAVALAARQGVI
jgi:DNA-binding CsgD family transcriptional regulator